MEERITITDINKKYGERIIYDKFSIEVVKGKTTCILGKSGCGKTTLLKMICEKKEFKGDISYVFQEDRLIPWISVYKNMEFVIKNKYNRQERKNIIERHLGMLNIKEYGSYYPKQLSGGIRQRVDIGRAFVHPCKMLLMDEPFKSLDINTKTNIINDFKELVINEEKTVILVTHDVEEALSLGDYIYVIGEKPVKVLESYEVKKYENTMDVLKQSILNTIN